jgi:hypothetical protein
MDVERIIDEIEQLKEMFGAPDIGHSAQPTSLMPIEGMTKCSRIAHGSGCRNGMDFVAEAKASSGLGFRANRIPLERRVTPHTNRSTLQHQRSRNIALMSEGPILLHRSAVRATRAALGVPDAERKHQVKLYPRIALCRQTYSLSLGAKYLGRHASEEVHGFALGKR